MSEKSHLTLKEASELTGFPYPAIKGLFEFVGIKLEKQGGSLICDKHDAEAVVLALQLAYSQPCDAVDKIENKMDDEMDDAGIFVLEDSSHHKAKRCPFCGRRNLVLRTKYIDDKDMFYAFVQCKSCRASSGSSSAYTKSLMSEKEAIEKWNERPSKE